MGWRVHILTEGFITPNGRAFLWPLLRHRKLIAQRGVRLTLFTSLDAALTDCDLLIVDSKFHRWDWHERADTVLEQFQTFQERVGRVLFFDTGDNSGWIVAQVLPFVQGYYKNQLLKDRELYLSPLYGNRLFTDFHHRRFGVQDAHPAPPAVVSDPAHLKKLALSWNSALCDYSRWGPRRMALFQRLRWPILLGPADEFHPSSAPRPNKMACRVTVNYASAAVAHQRRMMVEKLGEPDAGRRVSRGVYWKELRSSRLVVSPFGWGEIAYRDYETFLAGAALLKPDMSHMETWPDLYRPDESILVHRWDLADLAETIDESLANPARTRAVAEAGQALYRGHLIGAEAGCRFAERFIAIVAHAMGQA